MPWVFLGTVFRHCLSTSSPTGPDTQTQFPAGIDIPHVAAPPGGKLPPGEACYTCDTEDKDLPLQRRNKRSVTKDDDEDNDDDDRDDIDVLIREYQYKLSNRTLIIPEAVEEISILRVKRSTKQAKARKLQVLKFFAVG